MAHVRGCMVIKPWGFGIWRGIQENLGRMIRELGHEDAYFPLFVPLSYIQKEAQHVKGFAKEMAVVTHHRLEERDGKLVAAGELAEPLVVRPTSETIIGESLARWITSYRDLPMRINQWCNVVRWEMRPRVFLRTTEFLWQEGHTAHATETEAREEVMQMLELYQRFVQEWMAIPVIAGRKPAYDRFPGAEETLAIEAMMQDGRALQVGTSHYLGQNFSKAAEILFSDAKGSRSHVYTTSWGVSTRLIGALIMTHGDDDGLRLPPKLAPKQAVIIPVVRGNADDAKVLEFGRQLTQDLQRVAFGDGMKICVQYDDRPRTAPEKRWQWIRRGIPLIIEIGPREVGADSVSFVRRTRDPRAREVLTRGELIAHAGAILDEIQSELFAEALARLEERIYDVSSFEKLSEHLGDQAARPGFVRAFWRPTNEVDERLKDLGITIRCVPFEQEALEGRCILTGELTKTVAIFAKAY